MLMLMSKLLAKAYWNPISPYRTIIRKSKNRENRLLFTVYCLRFTVYGLGARVKGLEAIDS